MGEQVMMSQWNAAPVPAVPLPVNADDSMLFPEVVAIPFDNVAQPLRQAAPENIARLANLTENDRMLRCRIENGQCPTCGIQTHVKRRFLRTILVPKNNSHVRKGRCLLCTSFEISTAPATTPAPSGDQHSSLSALPGEEPVAPYTPPPSSVPLQAISTYSFAFPSAPPPPSTRDASSLSLDANSCVSINDSVTRRERVKICGVWGEYNGEFNHKGERHGKGTFHWDDGDQYAGEWIEGKQHGLGTFYWHVGHMYYGEWKHGKRVGHGFCICADGNVYDGGWKGGKMSGRGTYTMKNNCMYEGEWDNGKKEGRGRQTYADGSKYDGEYREGKKHGRGTFTSPDGSMRICNYHAGKNVGTAIRRTTIC